MVEKVKSKNMDKVYRLRLISKEDIKEYVYEAMDGALIRKYGDSLVMEHIELKPK